MFPTTLLRHSSVRAPLVENNNNAWAFTFSLATVPHRSSQTTVVTWTHHEGRPTLHTTHRPGCLQIIRGLLMFSGSQSVLPSKPWLEGEEEHISLVVLKHRCLVGVTWHLSQCLHLRGARRGSSREGSG